MFHRKILSQVQKSKKSVLLLGPRQCGKSTLMKLCEPQLLINLARETEFLEFSSDPGALEARLGKRKLRTVLIDEVQRIPSLLNTIQAILDDEPNPPKFLLTGSSARKLKRGQANLLPGRVRVFHLGPLYWEEFRDSDIAIQDLLSTGSLPGVLSEQDPAARRKLLQDYAGTYLKEEIQAEALASDIPGFSRFLKYCATWVGQSADLSKIASEAQIKRPTAVRYLEILEDTLLAERVYPFAKSERKRLIQHPKVYLFDVGVWNGLLGNFVVSPDRIGTLFEHFIYNQISAAAKAADQTLRVSTYRTEHGAEVDLIVEKGSQVFALELKASKAVSKHDLRGFQSFKEFYGKQFHPMVVYLGEHAKVVDGVSVLPWAEALGQLRIGV